MHRSTPHSATGVSPHAAMHGGREMQTVLPLMTPNDHVLDRTRGQQYKDITEILIDKVCRLNIPRSIINWIIDFLSNRIQRVKLPEDCYSEFGSVPSGVPQGTKLGPWLFILMIQDLDIDSPYLWKFVDDTTASELLPKGSASQAQNIVDRVIQWSDENRVQLHPDKCKELRITFSKNPSVLDPLIVNGKEIETVDNVKLLAVTMSSDLTWNAHIEEVF